MTLIDLRKPKKDPQIHLENFFNNLKKNGYISVILANAEIEEIIVALEAKAGGKETELGNDLKMVLAGKL